MPKLKRRYTFTILGIPTPKQSFRFTKTGHKYQTSKVVQDESNTRAQIVAKLPKKFSILDEPLKMEAEYVFPFPSSFSKKNILLAKSGKRFYKSTKPDISDNLNKGYLDAMQGVVFLNDSLVCEIRAVKYYGFTPKVVIKIETLG